MTHLTILGLPPRSQLITAFGLALVFAIPMVTLISCMVVFPILFYGALAIFVNVGLLALPLVLGLDLAGLAIVSENARNKWILATIIWTGCAVGISNWGAASSIGGKDTPFLEVFFAPIVMLLGFKIG
ncbi:MAG: hypothetical protein KDJ37_13210 [Hyphomicrobiaceae bacterium]|nr:hypothetical protein [Hyphomicrobiaceae bacterium]